MNLSSGVFTAPTAGIYLFTFSALKTNVYNGVNIYLELNEVLFRQMDIDRIVSPLLCLLIGRNTIKVLYALSLW